MRYHQLCKTADQNPQLQKLLKDVMEYRRSRRMIVILTMIVILLILEVYLLSKLSFGFRSSRLKSHSIFKNRALKCRNCSIPEAVLLSEGFHDKYRSGFIDRRISPRKVYNLVTYHNELDLLEIRLNELSPVVDYFLVAEANYDLSGEKKPLYLKQQLQNGTFRNFKHKLIYVILHTTNDEGEHLLRQLRERLLKTLETLVPHEDDLIILNDADEIPTFEVIRFLKFYKGFRFPVCLRMQYNMYGFFMGHMHDSYIVPAITSVRSLRRRLNNRINGLRNSSMDCWTIGKGYTYAGWHCSWCLGIRGTIIKMQALPKYGKYALNYFAHNYNQNYVLFMMRSGKFFDGKVIANPINRPGKPFAPNYFLENMNRLEHLMPDFRKYEAMMLAESGITDEFSIKRLGYK